MFYGVPASESLEEFAKIRVWRDMDIRLPAGTYHAFLPSKGYTSWNPWAGLKGRLKASHGRARGQR